MYSTKFAILSKLNEDLKEFQTEESYLETKRLIEQNQKRFIKKDNISKKELNQALEIEEKQKARFVEWKFLSDWSYEAWFIDSDWVRFNKIYSEGSFFYKQMEDKKEEEERKIKIQNFTENEFAFAFPSKIKKQVWAL